MSAYDTAVLLDAVSADGTGPVVNAGDLKDQLTMVVAIGGSVADYSVQLLGSVDGVTFVDIGVPDSSGGAAGSEIGPVTQSTGPVAVSAGLLMQYFKATLASYSGTGTVTATLGWGTD